MTQIRFAAAALLATLAAAASAEIPLMTPVELKERASHIVTGKVMAVYTKERQGKDWHNTKGVVEILVSEVEQGDRIEPGDAVYARFWTQRWIGKGIPPPFGSGHHVLKEGEQVRAHLARKDGGYEALLPNGIVPLRTAEEPKETP